MRALSIMLAGSLLCGCNPATHSRAGPRAEAEAHLTGDASRPIVFVAGLDMESRFAFQPRAFYVDALPTEMPPQPLYAYHFPGHAPFGLKEHWWNIWLTRNAEGDAVEARVRFTEPPWIAGDEPRVHETTLSLRRDDLGRQVFLGNGPDIASKGVWFFFGFVEVTEPSEVPRFDVGDAVPPPREETKRE